MRIVPSVLLTLCLIDPVAAQDTRVVIHSARPFGYFVGDLIHARVEIFAPANASLSTASLPRPGPLGVSLELRDVGLRQSSNAAGKSYEIALVYQSFYVALDVRNMEIPSFVVRVGDEAVTVPAWRVGVAPLREIAPARQDHAEDYLRPDPAPVFVGTTSPKRRALALAALSLLALGAVAHDRCWPPFQRRRARIFNALARRLAAQGRQPQDAHALTLAMQGLHRAIDVANGAALLAEDLPAFLERRPEFVSLRSSFERFFAGSHASFFADRTEQGGDYNFAELLDFAKALARQERLN